jgi:hypothetical protein
MQMIGCDLASGKNTIFRENSMGMHIVIVGDLLNGFEFFGPFKTAPDAVRFGESVRHGEWTIAPLAKGKADANHRM